VVDLSRVPFVTEAFVELTHCRPAVLLTGFIVNAPPVRSRLKTPIVRVVTSGLLAALITAGGLLIEDLVLNAR
jgi:hypothetical protein